MAFLDDISRSISDVSQKAINKGKEVAEISKINSALSEEEKILKRNYIEIGKLYCSKHGDDGNPEFADMVNAVKASENNIRQLEEKIRTVKNISVCEKCGAEIPSGTVFCNKCGTKQEQKVDADVSQKSSVCSKCGKILTEGMRFCTSCGTPVQS